MSQPPQIQQAPVLRRFELWVSLADQGFPNYQVSSFGRVRNVNRNHILNGTKTLTGYIVVTITRADGIPDTKFVHVLVATAFIPNPEGKLTVDHKDRHPDNNNVDNQ